ATTGQNAIAQVEVFDEAIDIDGIVLTKSRSLCKARFNTKNTLTAIKKLVMICKRSVVWRIAV
ncbi:MAG: hypothetical protein IJO44_09060, partial [Clostridia bacterium]|nr:hypothetical protein [Clostridia bacterium]